MFKRNRRRRQAQKTANKLRTLLRFHLRNCVGLPYNEESRDKVNHYAMLAMQHFLKKNYYYWVIRLGETND